jgi:hypothetical protein
MSLGMTRWMEPQEWRTTWSRAGAWLVSCEPGQDEAVEERDHQVELSAEVVAEKIGVDAVAGQVEEAFVRFVVEAADAVRGRLDDLGVGVHLDEVGVHAEEVHEVVVERRPEARGAVIGAGRVEGPERLREIEDLRVGPVEAGELGRVLDRG